MVENYIDLGDREEAHGMKNPKKALELKEL